MCLRISRSVFHGLNPQQKNAVLMSRLVEKAGTLGSDTGRSADSVMIASVIDHYCDHHGDRCASAFQAKRAAEVMNEFLTHQNDIAAKASSFGPIRQRQFMGSQDTLGHSPATIARNLSVLSAAFRFAASLQQITDGFGRQSEVVLLDQAPAVVSNGAKVAELLDVAERHRATGSHLPGVRELYRRAQQAAGIDVPLHRSGSTHVGTPGSDHGPPSWSAGRVRARARRSQSSGAQAEREATPGDSVDRQLSRLAGTLGPGCADDVERPTCEITKADVAAARRGLRRS